MKMVVCISALLLGGCFGPIPVFFFIKGDESSTLKNPQCIGRVLEEVATIESRKLLKNVGDEEYIYRTKNSDFSKRLVVYSSNKHQTTIYHTANFPNNIGCDGLRDEKQAMSQVAEHIDRTCGTNLLEFTD